MTDLNKNQDAKTIGFIGFGEAGAAFARGLSDKAALPLRAFDLKTGLGEKSRQQKLQDYARAQVQGMESASACAGGAQLLFSLVTADQAVKAAARAAEGIGRGCYYFDGNSCAPETKREAARMIEAAGGRYVDMAIMGPVHPAGHKTPVLLAGKWSDDALAILQGLGMQARLAGGGVGAAAAIKLIRSVMFKGMEALVAECFLSAQKAGVTGEVLASLEKSYPGFGWESRAGYMLERMQKHGIRRAAEMREAALCVQQLGLDSAMSAASAQWQQRLGDLSLKPDSTDLQAQAKMILAAMDRLEKPEEKI